MIRTITLAALLGVSSNVYSKEADYKISSPTSNKFKAGYIGGGVLSVGLTAVALEKGYFLFTVGPMFFTGASHAIINFKDIFLDVHKKKRERIYREYNILKKLAIYGHKAKLIPRNEEFIGLLNQINCTNCVSDEEKITSLRNLIIEIEDKALRVASENKFNLRRLDNIMKSKSIKNYIYETHQDFGFVGNLMLIENLFFSSVVVAKMDLDKREK